MGGQGQCGTAHRALRLMEECMGGQGQCGAALRALRLMEECLGGQGQCGATPRVQLPVYYYSRIESSSAVS